MAAMEKITYPPLVAHLQDQHNFYNQLYLDHELKYVMADTQLLHKWIVGVIEPIVVEATKNNQQRLPDIFKEAATYVDKILKGAAPADLPIEQPTTFELVVNLKAAKALGVTIPESILLRASEVLR